MIRLDGRTAIIIGGKVVHITAAGQDIDRTIAPRPAKDGAYITIVESCDAA